MKKILSTLLAALIVSVAMVSDVDARTVKGGARQTTRQPRRGRGARRMSAAKPADVLNAAKDLTDAKKDAAKTPEAPVTQQPAVKQAAQVVVATLTDPNMTPEQQELVQKRIKRADLERSIRLKRDEISDIGYGWFGFGTTDEQKASYREAKTDLTNFNANLKEVNARIRELEVATGKAWSNAVRFGIAALATVGIIGTAYGVDQYGFMGMGGKGEYTKAVMEYGKETWQKYGPERFTGAAAKLNEQMSKQQDLEAAAEQIEIDEQEVSNATNKLVRDAYEAALKAKQ